MLSPSKSKTVTSRRPTMISSLPATAFFSQAYPQLGISFNPYMLCNWSALNTIHDAHQKALQATSPELGSPPSVADNSHNGKFINFISWLALYYSKRKRTCAWNSPLMQWHQNIIVYYFSCKLIYHTKLHISKWPMTAQCKRETKTQLNIIIIVLFWTGTIYICMCWFIIPSVVEVFKLKSCPSLSFGISVRSLSPIGLFFHKMVDIYNWTPLYNNNFWWCRPIPYYFTTNLSLVMVEVK